MSQQTSGIYWFILHCFLFAVISTITKNLQNSIDIFQIIFIQTFLGALILLPFIYKKISFNISRKELSYHIARAFLWLVATALFFIAAQKMNLAKTLAISFSVPIFTSILAIIILKERINTGRIIALIFGFIGMLVIIRPGTDNYDPISLIVVLAAFFWSITDIIIHKIGKINDAKLNSFYFLLFSSFFALPLSLIDFKIIYFNGSIVFLGINLIFLSILCVINMISISKAFAKAPLTIVMPFTFTQLIFVAILAYFAFGEIIKFTTLIGAIIISFSNSWLAYYEYRIMKKL